MSGATLGTGSAWTANSARPLHVPDRGAHSGDDFEAFALAVGYIRKSRFCSTVYMLDSGLLEAPNYFKMGSYPGCVL